MSAALLTDPVTDLPRILRAASALGIVGGDGPSGPRLLAALCNPRASNDGVSTLICREPGLAARVLKVANSAFYGRSRSVTTIERALCVLGLDAARSIAAAACFERTMMRAPESALIQRTSYVSHSLAVATAAEALAHPQRSEIAGDAFMAGLLHNLGVPIQVMAYAPNVKELIASLALDPEQDVRETERRQGLIGHEACAAVVFDAWHLSAPLIDAAANHHHPLQSPAANRSLTWLVHFGLQIAKKAGFGFPLEPSHPVRDATAMAMLGLGDAVLDDVQAALPDRLAGLQGAFGD